MKRFQPKPFEPIYNEELEREIDRRVQDPRLRAIFKANLSGPQPWTDGLPAQVHSRLDPHDRKLVEEANRQRRKDWLLFWIMIGLCLVMLVLSEIVL